MQALSEDELVQKVEEKAQQRKDLSAQIDKLVQERSAYVPERARLVADGAGG